MRLSALSAGTSPAGTELIPAVQGGQTVTLTAAQLAQSTAAALTKTDDTNVTLTLGGTPASSVLKATSITVGWSGTLAVARGGTGSSTASGARGNLGLVTTTTDNAVVRFDGTAGATQNSSAFIADTGWVALGYGGAGGRWLDIRAETTANTANQVRIFGYQASFEVLNNAGTQNYYFGVDDNDGNKLKIGGGRSPGQGLAAAIVVDPANSDVIVGNSATTLGARLNVINTASTANDWIAWFRREGTATPNESLIRHEHFSNFAGTTSIPQPIFAGIANRGTIASPVTLASGDPLLILDGRGYDGTATSDTAAQINFLATQTWTNSAHGSKINLLTTANGSTSPVIRATIDQDGVTTFLPTVATPAAGSTAARLLFGTTAGFGIYYGSGAPTVSAAQGSLYLRSDGSSTSTRAYINTNGSTTWTAITTAA